VTRSDSIDPPHAALALDRVVVGKRVVVAVSGELDITTSQALLDALTPDVLPDGTTRVTLDLSEVTFMDSTGIGAFVQARKALRPFGVELVLLRPPERLARRLEIMGINQLLPIQEQLDPA
jgi:anti-sigma B factor antagonist